MSVPALVLSRAFVSVFALVVIAESTALSSSRTFEEIVKRERRQKALETFSQSVSGYTFQYVTVLIPGAELGLDQPNVPVFHIRYDENVFFEYNKSDLSPLAIAAAKDMATFLEKEIDIQSVVVVGHTDSRGTAEYNFELAQRRALGVMNQLIVDGVDVTRLSAVPMGEAQPIASNSSESGRARNRRVELFVSDNREAPLSAVKRAVFDPCFRNDHEALNENGENCDSRPVNIPVLVDQGDGPVTSRNLQIVARSRFETSPIYLSRPSLPSSPLSRRPFGL